MGAPVMTTPASSARPVAARDRVALIDALRALALFGILQVNIQSYVWGATSPLGLFGEQPSTADSAAYLLVATFVQMKFIALFAFLFGVGFALQMRSLRRALPDPAAARGLYRRRLVFLLLLGMAHGTLLYYGDILTAYALGGFILVLYADARPARLVQAARNWWIGYAVLTLGLWLMIMLSRGFAPAADPTDLPAAAVDTFLVNTEGSYLAMLPGRVTDYLIVTSMTVTVALPFVLGLFLLGTLAGRLGWLTHPQRHRRLWRGAVWLGLASLPLCMAGAWLDYQDILNRPGDPAFLGFTLLGFGFGLSALYLALIIRQREHPAVRAAVAWLAPAGRMPLTNYLMQSLIMGTLLSGWGFGLGMQWRHAELAVLALVIVAVQIVLSRWWIARFGQGPLERLWRAWTYRGSAPAAQA
jgi:uncharacterized protein